MTYVRKPKTATSAVKLPTAVPQIKPAPVQVDPVVQRQRQVARAVQGFTALPHTAMKKAVKPAFAALQLQREEQARVEESRPGLASQIRALSETLPAAAVEEALQRQRERAAPPP